MDPKRTTVRIYSNGMMDFQCFYDLKPGVLEEFEFPFHEDHIDDVLSTFRVMGDVTIPQSLTFSAVNAEETKLVLDPLSPTVSLFKGLAGAKVKLSRHNATEVFGRVLGIEESQVILDGTVTKKYIVAVMRQDGTITRSPLDQVESFEFKDVKDESEIQKALDKHSKALRPGTSMMRFSLQPKQTEGGVVPAMVKWVIPDAAFCMTYRLLIGLEGKFSLEANAVIHNFTDQPWKSTTIEILGGTPHTFKGNTSTAVVPTRTNVNLVDATAVGGRTVAASKGIRPQSAPPRMALAASMGSTLESAVGGRGFPGDDSNSLMQMASGSGSTEDYEYGYVDQPEAGVTAISGFTRFVCPNPVESLDAKKSTLAFLFRRDLPDAKTILHYSQERGGSHPDRTFFIKNTTGIALPRGAISVEVQGEDKDYVSLGKAELQQTQPDKDQLVVYATESSVTVEGKSNPLQVLFLSVSFENGTAKRVYQHTLVTRYTVANSGSEDFEVYLDQKGSQQKTKMQVSCEGEECSVEEPKKGLFRATIQVPKDSTVQVVFRETYTVFSDVLITHGTPSNRTYYLSELLIACNHDLDDNPTVKELLELGEKIDKANKAFKSINDRKSTLTHQHKRAKDALDQFKNGPEEDRARYVKEFSESYDAIKKIEDQEIPEAQAEITKLEEEYNAKARAWSLTWKTEA